MYNIDIYNNSEFLLNKKIPKKIINWITVLLILLVLFLIIINIPYNKYKSYIGCIKFTNNSYYVELKVGESDFPINISNKLYIKDKEYKYKVIGIEKDLVKIDLKLDKEYLSNNNIVIINILSKRTSLLNLFSEKIKKGLGLC